ncbi:heavy-metal-associated domain-containing protein [Acidocella sp.]|uniref:heavy-metal-associated domain-containing protein n=1 Tax=Acidocella sp. TaxID=50710 RepID=UPI00262C0A95|nr:cation transporter [Acidocella sp.]
MAESTPLQFKVPDMRDDDSVRAITEAVRKIDPHAHIVADLKTGRVMIGAEIDAGRAAEAIEAAGFSPCAAG